MYCFLILAVNGMWTRTVPSGKSGVQIHGSCRPFATLYIKNSKHGELKVMASTLEMSMDMRHPPQLIHCISQPVSRIIFIRTYALFTLLRVGWPPTPQVYFGPKHLFLQCFQCSGIQKHCKILLCTMFFFIFGRFSIAGKLPK